jgi:hypothetical protein
MVVLVIDLAWKPTCCKRRATPTERSLDRLLVRLPAHRNLVCAVHRQGKETRQRDRAEIRNPTTDTLRTATEAGSESVRTG